VILALRILPLQSQHVLTHPVGQIGTNLTTDQVQINGGLRVVNSTGRSVMLERENDDSWITFHDPNDAWYSIGIDRTNGATFSLNYGSSLTSINGIVMKPSGHVGIGNPDPWERLHVDGILGIGKFATTGHAGLQIQYTDLPQGSGSTVFKHQRWGGEIYFKRNSANGERKQFYFGGASSHYMLIYDSNDVPKIQMNAGGDSFITGGRLGIGTTDIDESLTVRGKIHTSEVRVDLEPEVAPDYVFEKDYNLLPLSELESYIKANKHLPEVPSAKEMEANGMNLKEMNLILLKKVEELTLHLIAEHAEKDVMKKEMEEQKRLTHMLQKQMQELVKK
jgi:hypothetical protein